MRDRFSTANRIADVNEYKDDRSALSQPEVCHIYLAPSKSQGALDQGAMTRFASLLVVAAFSACASDRLAEKVSSKVTVDLSNVNAEGLRGPAHGLRTVHYELCIPADERYAAEVRSIDPTARLVRGSPGRIRCTNEQALVLGYTH